MARSQNPMEAFRREQKKKELKKHQVQRQKEKQAKLGELDVDEIRERLNKLERQVQKNPADGPTRKRKQELEDTLQAALKKQKAMEEEQKQKEEAAKGSMTIADINAANRERYQNPENSIYYHPVLNPFGAPPPGRPQMYRVPPPAPTPPPPKQGFKSREATRTLPPAPRRPVPGPTKPQRPGKRPPLPPGPPPPGTITIPSKPPLPTGGLSSTTNRPTPPPPPPNAPPMSQSGMPPYQANLPPPPPAPVTAAYAADVQMQVDVTSPIDRVENTTAASEEYTGAARIGDSDDDEDRVEQQMRLRSLVPTTLRVQRVPKAKPIQTSTPRPLPPPSAPGPSLPTVPPPPPPQPSSSAPSEFDAFMEEMKSLGAV